MGEIMKEISANPSLKSHIKDAAAFVPRLIKNLNKFSSERRASLLQIKQIDEKRVLSDALPFLKERFSSEIAVCGEEDKERYDPKQRAQLALPTQPAIYIE